MVPIKIQKEVIGISVVVRQEARPFGKTEQALLEAICNYVSISLLNARLFKALGDSRGGEKQNTLLESVRSSLAEGVQSAVQPLDLLLAEKLGGLTDAQRQAVQAARLALQRLTGAMEKAVPPDSGTLKKK